MIDKEYWLRKWKRNYCLSSRLNENEGHCYNDDIKINPISEQCVKCPYN